MPLIWEVSASYPYTAAIHIQVKHLFQEKGKDTTLSRRQQVEETLLSLAASLKAHTML